MLVRSLFIFLFGLAVCYFCILLTLNICKRSGKHVGGLDQPDGLRKNHSHAIPRIGGVSIFLSFLAVLVATLLIDSLPLVGRLPALAAGTTAIFLLGLIDDFRPLPAQLKLIGQVSIAILTWWLGLRVELVTNPLTDAPMELSSAVSFAATVVWLVAIPNVVNLADGMDGLAGGIGLFLCLTLGVVGILSPFHQGLAILGFGMAGAILAFLRFNFPPAKIFMGDGGAYFIGFFIAAASLGSSQKSYIGASLAVTLIALGLPILDTVISFFRRYIKGVPVMRGDSEHIHHRLLLTGMSSGKALFILYGIFLTLSIIALSTILAKAISIWMALGFLVLISIIAIRGLGYVRSWRTVPADLRRILGARREVRYAGLVSQVIEMEIERQSDATAFWKIFEEDLIRLEFGVAPSDSTENIMPAITMNYPFKGVQKWTIEDKYNKKINPLTREAIASCFITALCLGMKKFGHPGWRGVVSNHESIKGLEKKIDPVKEMG